MFAGKGGVGKTSIAGATGLKAAGLGKKTLILSLDAAHSLCDIFDLDKGLMDKNRGLPVKIEANLWIQELDIQEEIQRNWGDIHKYIATLFNTTGLDEILSEELAVLPGMEEVSALLHLNTCLRESTYDVIILDCAPTGESLRFISIPSALEWYIAKIFKLERTAVKLLRPVAEPLFKVPLPEEAYFNSLEKLFHGLQGMDKVLTNPKMTTVRLVANPEKIVLKETQRAFMYFSLHKMCIDAVVMNRVLPRDLSDSYFGDWKNIQQGYMKLAESYFHPVPVFPVTFLKKEPLGTGGLAGLSEVLYKGADPTVIFFKEQPYLFRKNEENFFIRIKLPFIEKQDVELNRLSDELLIRIGHYKRHVPLPRHAGAYKTVTAKMEGDYLNIIFGGKKDASKKK
jgi:arsenite-transporting ATPase